MIARALERAFAAYLISQSESGGGLYRIETAEGAGVDLQVRTAHDERGEFPEDGVVICRCLGDAVQRVHVGVNAWRAVMTVELRYPYDAYASDPHNVPAYEYVVAEMDSLLTGGEAMIPALNDLGTGVEIGSFAEGEMTTHEIDGERRKTWVLPLLVHQTEHRPDLQPVIT